MDSRAPEASIPVTSRIGSNDSERLAKPWELILKIDPSGSQRTRYKQDGLTQPYRLVKHRKAIHVEFRHRAGYPGCGISFVIS